MSLRNRVVDLHTLPEGEESYHVAGRGGVENCDVEDPHYLDN
jgi:hypothetical protein